MNDQKPPIQPDYIPFKSLMHWVIILSVSLVICCVVCIPMMKGLGSLYSLYLNKPQPHMRISSAVPPEPRLQVHDAQDMAEFLQQQQQQLASYGWVDRPKRIVRIPIERAIELISKEGLPQ